MSAVLKLVFSLLKMELLKVLREIQAETWLHQRRWQFALFGGKVGEEVMGVGRAYNMIYNHLIIWWASHSSVNTVSLLARSHRLWICGKMGGGGWKWRHTTSLLGWNSGQTYSKGHVALQFDACEWRVALRADRRALLNVNVPTWMTLHQSLSNSASFWRHYAGDFRICS